MHGKEKEERSFGEPSQKKEKERREVKEEEETQKVICGREIVS